MAVIVLAGTGSVSQAVAHALVVNTKGGEKNFLIILGRKIERAQQSLAQAQSVAASLGHSLDGQACEVDWNVPSSIAAALEGRRPDLVVQFASEQPPSELRKDDAWSTLVKSAGFGVTLPLHLPPLRSVCRALEMLGLKTPILNACFPDLVNVVAHKLGWPVIAGFGNVATVAAIARGASVPLQSARFVGCHHHLSRYLNDSLDIQHMPRGFYKTAMDEVPRHELLKTLRESFKPVDISSLTATTALPIIRALCGLDDRWNGTISGPLGAVGGIPCIIESKHIRFDVSGLDLDALTKWNAEQECGDGLSVGSSIVFTSSAIAHIRKYDQQFSEVWDIAEAGIDSLIECVRDLKKKLQSNDE